MRLVKRLSTDQQLARYKGQFVPLKVTTSGDDWQRWSRKHGSPGNSIPMVYVVRADGELLYSGVGSMPGQELFAMLNTVTGKMGVLLNDQQLASTEEAIAELEEVAEDLPGTMKVIERLKKKKMINDADCYARPFTELQEKVDAILTKEFDGTMEGFTAALRLQQSMLREKNRVRGIRAYMKVLGDDPNRNMVEFGWDVMQSTKINWVSTGGDRMPGTLVSLEGEGELPESVVLRRLNGKTIGPLPLSRFSDDSRELANAMVRLQTLHEALPSDPVEDPETERLRSFAP